jgi:hypothetical protein
VNDQTLFAFIRSAVRSVWALELLLLMRREPGRTWTPQDLVRELRASTTVVEDALRVFQAAGLVGAADGGFLYAPASPTMAALCDSLEQAYRERPVKIINAIVAPTSPVQGFADAFRIKGEPE